MSNKIVTFDNCKVGDKVFYTESYLLTHGDYRKYMKQYAIVYLKIVAKNLNYGVELELYDYKGKKIYSNFNHRIKEDLFVFYEG